MARGPQNIRIFFFTFISFESAGCWRLSTSRRSAIDGRIVHTADTRITEATNYRSPNDAIAANSLNFSNQYSMSAFSSIVPFGDVYSLLANYRPISSSDCMCTALVECCVCVCVCFGIGKRVDCRININTLRFGHKLLETLLLFRHPETHWAYIAILSFVCTAYMGFRSNGAYTVTSLIPWTSLSYLSLHKSSSVDSSGHIHRSQPTPPTNTHTRVLAHRSHLKFTINANHDSVQNHRIASISPASIRRLLTLIKYAKVAAGITLHSTRLQQTAVVIMLQDIEIVSVVGAQLWETDEHHPCRVQFPQYSRDCLTDKCETWKSYDRSQITVDFPQTKYRPRWTLMSRTEVDKHCLQYHIRASDNRHSPRSRQLSDVVPSCRINRRTWIFHDFPWYISVTSIVILGTTFYWKKKSVLLENNNIY